MIRTIVAVALCFLALTSLTGKGNAENAPAPRRPLVFIPGIIGSELWSGNERLWGGLGDIRHLDKLAIQDGPRDIQPLGTCSEADLADSNKRQTCGPVETFSTLPPFSIDQYAPLFQHLESMGYKRSGPDRNLFVFPYDWRLSNFQTADDLQTFVNTQSGLAGKPFDILAHSMGGLVTIIFAYKYDSPQNESQCTPELCRIQTVITLGTPFWGSMSAISTLDTGWGVPWSWIAGGQDTIRKTILSWPSVYEMLPTYDDCCFDHSSKGDIPMDVVHYENWRMLPFTSASYAPSEDHVRAALGRASDLKTLTRKGFPPYLSRNPGPCDPNGDRFFAITGDHFDTDAEFRLSSGQLRYTEKRGDDTVLVRSSNFGNMGRAFISFTKHRRLFTDDHVSSEIRNILLRCDLNIQNFGAPNLSLALQPVNGGPSVTAGVYTVAIDAKPALPTAGDPCKVRVKLDLETFEEVIPPTGTLTVTINGKLFYTEELNHGQKASTTDGNRTAFEYNSADIAIPESGVAIFSAQFPDIGILQTDALVLANTK